MRSDVAIETRGLGKMYEVYRKPVDRAKQLLVGRRKTYFEEFWAVRNVDLEIRRGESIGIIGRNGSGKSTLLQLVCGIVAPTAGTLAVNGKIAAMLALGAGFSPELTGRENVYVAATVLGLSSAQIGRRFESIVEFAELASFIDQPVRHYSSGMYARLAFAVCAHVDADILIIDEILAVGDAVFGQRCMRFIREFQKRGTVLLVSHDLAAVANVCNRVIWLDRGRVGAQGAPAGIIHEYVSSCYAAKDTEGAFQTGTGHDGAEQAGSVSAAGGSVAAKSQLNPLAPWFGIRGATITDVTFTDARGAPLAEVRGGEAVVLRIKGRAERDLILPIVGFIVHDRLGQQVFVDNTFLTHSSDPVRIAAGSAFIGEFAFEMPHLQAGQYSICASIAEGTQDDHVQHHWINSAVLFEVVPALPVFGVFRTPMRVCQLRLLDTPNEAATTNADGAVA
jgi:lipopolysaccharide transport system ATP-binding protein